MARAFYDGTVNFPVTREGIGGEANLPRGSYYRVNGPIRGIQ